MIQMMLNAGLRASEVLSLAVRDLDWTSGKLAVKRGKGDKDRVVWLNEDDLEILRVWKEKIPESKLYQIRINSVRVILSKAKNLSFKYEMLHGVYPEYSEGFSMEYRY